MRKEDGVPSAMEVYDRFLRDLDAWFRSVRVKYGDRMQCGKGCTLCCRGLFDVTIPDALRVADGLSKLDSSLRRDALCRSVSLHAEILQAAPKLQAPYLLHEMSVEEIDSLADRFEGIRCPFLGSGDACLIYAYRPMACILEGVPMVDARDGLFDDWCSLNFTSGIGREVEEDLVLDYYGIEAAVGRAARSLQELAPFFPNPDATVFLPSVAAVFDTFWKNLLD
jgi:Fe-S-cluster containining protein